MVNKEMYVEKDLVGIAKRENNNKRKYLVVNKLQGKHVPVNPQKTLEMFDELAKLVKEEYKDEKVLLVGFAETATAIGSRLAVDMDSYYMQTTRENIDNVEYLYFTESHSHATEQKLIKTDLDKVIDKIERIVFVEDEVTTGNTILKIIDIIENTYEKSIAFSVASILNGMDEASANVYASRNIKLHYLVKTNHDSYSDIADSFKGDGTYHTHFEDCNADIDTYTVNGYVNARRLNKGMEYETACEKLWEQLTIKLDFKDEGNILVLGTEECMYPAIYVADRLVQMGHEVKTHSTTRSPIAVSLEEKYPVHIRYQLRSVYDDERCTFIYDLKKYDKVLIVTDAKDMSAIGIKDLCGALESCGNTDISVIRWCE